jgi:predicted GNAT family N-acyltransferase
MEIMIEANIFTSMNVDPYIFEIRRIVFGKELGIEEELLNDPYDKFAYFVVVSYKNKPVGTGRLIYKDDTYLIGRIAVLDEARGMKLGDLIVRMLIDFAFRLGATEVHVHSQLQVIDFYKKIGFKEQNDSFYELGILHTDMSICQCDIVKGCTK